MRGFAFGFDDVGLSRPVTGVQLYNSAPEANNFTEFPRHNVSPRLAFIINGCLTSIITESFVLQPKLFSALSINFVVLSGRAIGLAQFEQESKLAGLHK